MRDLHPLAVFETAPFNRLGTSPAAVILIHLAIFLKIRIVYTCFLFKNNLTFQLDYFPFKT